MKWGFWTWVTPSRLLPANYISTNRGTEGWVVSTWVPPRLHPDTTKAICAYMHTYTDYGLGASLRQKHDGVLFPVCFASKKLSDMERNYSTMEKAPLATARGSWSSWTISMEFTHHTNHQPVMNHNQVNFLSERIIRWICTCRNLRSGSNQLNVLVQTFWIE